MYSRNAGPFNLEHFQKAGEESRLERIRLTKSGPWGSIAIVNNSVMITPDALDLLGRNLADQERNANLVAAAFVVSPGTEGRLFCEETFSPVYAGAGAPFRLFETLEPAKIWVTEMIEAAADVPSSIAEET